MTYFLTNDYDQNPGSKGVGKTTLVHRFLEREEAPRQTLALEYTFGRYQSLSSFSRILHIFKSELIISINTAGRQIRTW